MKKLLLILAVPTLVACAQAREVLDAPPAVSPAKACTSYNTALGGVNLLIREGVIEAHGDIADRTADVVAVLAPICEDELPPTSNAEVIQKLLNGVADMLVIQADAMAQTRE